MLRDEEKYIRELYTEYVDKCYETPETEHRVTEEADRAFDRLEELLDTLPDFAAQTRISSLSMDMAVEYEESGFIAGYKTALEQLRVLVERAC